MKDPGCCDEDFHAQFCEAMCPEYFRKDGWWHSCDRTKGHAGEHSEGHESMSPEAYAKRKDKAGGG